MKEVLGSILLPRSRDTERVVAASWVDQSHWLTLAKRRREASASIASISQLRQDNGAPRERERERGVIAFFSQIFFPEQLGHLLVFREAGCQACL